MEKGGFVHQAQSNRSEMKIGILTFHRAHNYGAVLQCFALQEVLKGMGHEVEVIDYRQKWTEEVYKPFSFMVFRTNCRTLRNMAGYILGYFRKRKISKYVAGNYLSFQEKFLERSGIFGKDSVGQYDACIIGSDQLWSSSCLGNMFDSLYLGHISMKPGCKIIGYAISSNVASIDRLHKEGFLQSSLSNFFRISFREYSVLQRIKSYTKKVYPQCIDPTLLVEEDVWSPLLNRCWCSKRYVACYALRDGMGDTSVNSVSEKLAQKLGCGVISITNEKYRVEDFVSIIANAEYVVTTSFHATVFSLIFRRPLAAYLLHDGHDSRYEDLLTKVNATGFIYEVGEQPSISPEINWEDIHDNLAKYRDVSLCYLRDSLG